MLIVGQKKKNGERVMCNLRQVESITAKPDGRVSAMCPSPNMQTYVLAECETQEKADEILRAIAAAFEREERVFTVPDEF